MIESRVASRSLTSLLPQLSIFIAACLYCVDVLLRVSPGVLAEQLISHYKINQTAFSNCRCYFYIYAPMQILSVLMDRYRRYCYQRLLRATFMFITMSLLRPLADFLGLPCTWAS